MVDYGVSGDGVRRWTAFGARWRWCAAVALLGGGCADTAEESKGEPVTPVFTSAEGFAALLVDATGLCEDGTHALQFDDVATAYSFAFYLEAGQTAAVDTNGAPAFDAVLLVYGPANASGDYGSVPVAMDDDGGEHLAAALSYTSAQSGSYAVVVTSFSGEGQGATTLHIAVDEKEGCTLVETCLQDADCLDADGCTVDACSFGNCSHEPDPVCNMEPECEVDADCTTIEPCMVAMCVEGACATEPDPAPACNPPAPECEVDGDCATTEECTLAVCIEGTCAVIDAPAGPCAPECALDLDCIPEQPCTIGVCSNGDCSYLDDSSPECQPIIAECAVDQECDDDDACTVDSCSTGGECEHAAIEPCPGPALPECGDDMLPLCILQALDWELADYSAPNPIESAIETTRCRIRIARSAGSSEEEAATAVQLFVSVDPSEWEFMGMTDDMCFGAGICFDAPVVKWPLDVPAQPLSSGHTLETKPQELTPAEIAARGGIAMIAVNITDPNAALSDAIYHPDGTVEGVPHIFDIHFRPVEGGGAEFPAALCVPAGELLAATGNSDPLVATTAPDGLIVTKGVAE